MTYLFGGQNPKILIISPKKRNFSQQRRIKHVLNGVRDEKLPRIADEIE
jgi:hypothetical protein